MRPNDNDNRRLGTPLIPQRSYVQSPSSAAQQGNQSVSSADTQRHNDAAADIIRGQIDNLYNQDHNAHQPVKQPQTEQQHTPTGLAPESATNDQATPQQQLTYKNPYQRTQMNTGQLQAQQWKQYHSAWQDYYQKYYERYYIGQVQRTQQALESRAAQAAQHSSPPSTAPTPSSESAAEEPTSFSRDDALRDLRNTLRTQIHDSATKVRKSRHFVPIAAALGVMIVFLFLQYNRVLFANVHAYISPGNVDSANVIIDPMSELSVGDEAKLIIPKINVDVPADFNVTPDHNSQMASMENGVAWFGIPGANSKPGQIGNTVLSGHSSNDIIDQGNYKFIFARLDALQTGDNVYINYEGKRYVYKVTQKEVVKPTQVDKLVYPTDKPLLTLITCTPLGTSLNRLLVTAEQISPSPSSAVAAPEETSNQAEAAMPGNSPTFLQRVFGGS